MESSDRPGPALTPVETWWLRSTRIGLLLVGIVACAYAVYGFDVLVGDLVSEGFRRISLMLATTSLGGAVVGVSSLRRAWTADTDLLIELTSGKACGREHREQLDARPRERFTLHSARAAGVEGDLEAWVHRYLNGPGANPGFSDVLWLQRRWWRGPLEVPLSTLKRTCGPGPEMPWREPAEAWDRRTDELVAMMTYVEDWPPLIVEYVNGQLLIRDGNDRFAALERVGHSTCSIILWYPDEASYLKHGDNGFRIHAFGTVLPKVHGSG